MFNNKKKIEKLEKENERLNNIINHLQNAKIDTKKEIELKTLFKSKITNKSALRYINNCFTLYKKSKNIYLALYLLKLAKSLNDGKKYPNLGVV